MIVARVAQALNVQNIQLSDTPKEPHNHCGYKEPPKYMIVEDWP